MALQPHQLNQLHDDVDRVYFRYFLPIYGGDTGPWIVADSGGTSLPAAEAARLKGYADAHLTAHQQDGRARDIKIRLGLMGRSHDRHARYWPKLGVRTWTLQRNGN